MRRAAVLGALALALVGCGGGGSSAPELEPGTLRVGVLANLSTGRDRDLVRAARVAVDQVNAPGGIERKVRLRLLVRNTPTPQAAGQAARALTAAGVRMIVLPCEPAQQVGAVAVTQRRRAVAVAPCNTLPRLWLRFRFAWPAALGSNREAAALADALADDGLKQIGVLGHGAFVRYLGDALHDRGIAIGRVVPVVIGPGIPHALDRVLQHTQLSDQVFGTHTLEHAGVFRRSDDVFDGLVFTTFGFAEPGNDLDEFDVRYETLFGRRPASSGVARGYDAIRVISAAIDDANSTRPRDVAASIADGLDVHGAFGTLHYRPGRRNPEVSVAVVRVEHSRETLVDRVDPKHVPAP